MLLSGQFVRSPRPVRSHQPRLSVSPLPWALTDFWICATSIGRRFVNRRRTSMPTSLSSSLSSPDRECDRTRRPPCHRRHEETSRAVGADRRGGACARGDRRRAGERPASPSPRLRGRLFGRQPSKRRILRQVIGNIGAPGRVRTSNPRFRRPILYPVELRALTRASYHASGEA